jgi:hypothetical protein
VECSFVYHVTVIVSTAATEWPTLVRFMVEVFVNLNLRGDQKLYFVYCCADKD